MKNIYKGDIFLPYSIVYEWNILHENLEVRWPIEALIERDDEWEAKMIRSLRSERDW